MSLVIGKFVWCFKLEGDVGEFIKVYCNVWVKSYLEVCFWLISSYEFGLNFKFCCSRNVVCVLEEIFVVF